MGRRFAQNLASLALLLAVLSLSLPILELAVRVFAPQPESWFGLYREEPGPLPFGVQANLDTLIDAGAGWQIYTDARGYRTAKDQIAPTDAPQLLIVGDSFGFAYGVDYEDSFAGLLDIATGTTARVVNGSVPGYGPKHYKLRLEQMLQDGAQPTAILIPIYGGNDHQDCVWNKDRPIEDGILGGVPSGFKAWAKINTHLFRLISKVYHQVQQPPQQNEMLDLYRAEAWSKPFLTEAQGIVTRDIGEMSRISAEAGAPVFMVYIPALESVADAQGLARPKVLEGLNLHIPAEKYRALAQSLDMPFVDLTPMLAKAGAATTYFAWNRHLSEVGNKIAANTIIERWADLQPALRKTTELKKN